MKYDIQFNILAFLYFGISSKLDISGIPFAFKSFTIAAERTTFPNI